MSISEAFYKTGYLSDGRIYTIASKPKGRHMLQAQKQAGRDNARIPYFLVAAVTDIEGAAVRFDDLMDMNLEDVSILLQAVTGSADGTDDGENPTQPDNPSSD